MAAFILRGSEVGYHTGIVFQRSQVQVLAPASRLSAKYLKEVVGTTPTVSAMSSLLTDLGSVVTSTLEWVGDAVDTIVANPFLLLTTGVLMLGAAVGIIGRLLSRG